MQRIRGAIDRTIAEEQARQQKITDGGSAASVSRSGSTSSRGGGVKRPARAKKPSTDITNTDAAPPNPDPAVFEAAFVIDDSDEPSRAGTPKPQVPEKDGVAVKNGEGEPNSKPDDADASKAAAGDRAKGDGEDGAGRGTSSSSSSSSQDLSPEIKQRLRKLEKLEATYPGRLYRGPNCPCTAQLCQ